MHPVPLVATTRGYPETGYPVENIHFGSIAVVDAAGRLLYSSGDPDAMVFTRSGGVRPDPPKRRKRGMKRRNPASNCWQYIHE